MNEPLLGSAGAVDALAARLSRLPYVESRPSPHGEPSSWLLADSLRDIEGECCRLLDLLPKLVASSDSELGLALEEIRPGVQHIVFHLATTPWSRSLIDGAPELFDES